MPIFEKKLLNDFKSFLKPRLKFFQWHNKIFEKPYI